jgi:hypothetical protein
VTLREYIGKNAHTSEYIARQCAPSGNVEKYFTGALEEADAS